MSIVFSTGYEDDVGITGTQIALTVVNYNLFGFGVCNVFFPSCPAALNSVQIMFGKFRKTDIRVALGTHVGCFVLFLKTFYN